MENYWNRERPLFATGPIQLQTHGGEMRWRNLFVREIGPEEANSLLFERDHEGFVSLFNGKDLCGWTGAVDNYEVTDEGTIRCKPSKGGILYTEEEFDDFMVKLEFKLPKAATTGLPSATRRRRQYRLLRHDRTAGARYTLATPDWIDPRQAHGSAYGMVPAATGYLRPVGQWNYQEVTVKGSTIKVELNGTIILNADLAEVKEFMGGKPHPGKDRKKVISDSPDTTIPWNSAISGSSRCRRLEERSHMEYWSIGSYWSIGGLS